MTMASDDPVSDDWVALLREAGIDVDDDPGVAAWSAESGREIFACILAGPRPGGHVFKVSLLPDLPSEMASGICYEAIIRFDRAASHGYRC